MKKITYLKWLKTLFTFICLSGLYITVGMVTKNKFLLFSEHAKSGILSLQFAKNNTNQKIIFDEWGINAKDSIFIREYSGETAKAGKIIRGISVAKAQTQADNYFVVFYVLSTILLFAFIKAKGCITNMVYILLSSLILAAGIFDLIENFYVQSSITTYLLSLKTKSIFIGNAPVVFFFAVLKFITLGLTAISLLFVIYKNRILILTYLPKFSAGFLFILKQGWTFRIVLVLLFIFYAFTNFSDQGQDLIVTINTEPLGTLLFLTSISVLAALNWYLPKLYVNTVNKVKLILVIAAEAGNTDEEQDYARVLGVVTFLIPAVGILKTMQQYHMSFWLDGLSPFFLLISSIWFFAVIINKKDLDLIYCENERLNLKSYFITLILGFGIMLLFILFADNNQPPLSYLAIDLYLLAFLFYLTVLYRKDFWPVRDGQSQYRDSFVAKIIIISGLLFSGLFIAFNFKSVLFAATTENRFFTLTVVICAFITYSLMFSILLLYSKRLKFQLITTILLLGLTVSYFKISDFHKIKTVKPEREIVESLRAYVRRWLDDRMMEIQEHTAHSDTSTYPVFFINSYGGGIRASAWATTVIGALDETLSKRSQRSVLKNDFQHHVFSYSGASGGTVGFSLLVAERSVTNRKHIFRPDSGLRVYKMDYLTANVVGMFGRDLFMSLIGGSWYEDRAKLQELSFERTLDSTYQIPYGRNLQEIYSPNSTEVPMLFSNSFDINTAKKTVISPLYLDTLDFPSCLFLPELTTPKNQDLPLSTAAFLSARFPFVCPTGKFDEKHHFTDGGTLENSGGETSFQVLNVFNEVLKENKYKTLRISINILSISSVIPAIDNPQPEKNLYEIFAPAVGILGTINGNAIKADVVNDVAAKRNKWKYIRIRPTAIKINDAWPVLPLGWQISDDALNSMIKSIHEQNKLVDSILKVFEVKTFAKQSTLKPNQNENSASNRLKL